MVAPSDFKKIKAKVGKRAPVKPNVTDTSFRAVSLHISSQAGVARTPNETNNNTLVTARGMPLSQLLQQLQHPATSVRVSSVKGVQSILTQQGRCATTAVWLPHLSQILTALATAATIDTDPDVRQAGGIALRQLVDQLQLESKSLLLIPFTPFLTALVSTALNSLDIAQCQDGAATVEWLARNGIVEDAVVPQWIPPLVRLLTNNNHTKSTNNTTAIVPKGSMRKAKNNKKRKRANPSETANGSSLHSSKSPSALRAIHAVLQSTSRSTQENGVLSAKRQRPALTIAKSTVSFGVIFSRTGRTYHECRSPFTGLADFQSWDNLGLLSDGDDPKGTEQSRQRYHTTIRSLSTLITTDGMDLLGKLRDCLVESIHNKQLDSFLICTRTVRLFLQSIHGKALLDNIFIGGESFFHQRKRLSKLCSQIAASTLEWFPLTICSTSRSNNADVSETLVVLATTVHSISITPSVAKQDDVSHWITVVASYIQTCLEQDEEIFVTQDPMNDEELSTSDLLLKVLESLLMGTDFGKRHRIGSLQTTLVELFVIVFFHTDKSLTKSLARSAVGRAAAALACRLLEAGYQNRTMTNTMGATLRTDLLLGLPRYLVLWEADYPIETAACLCLLQDAIRRTSDESLHDTSDVNNGLTLDVVSQLKVSLEPLFIQPDHDLSRPDQADSPRVDSIFELYPMEIQRQLICFLVILSTPTPSTVTSLAGICAKCHLQDCTPMTTVSPVIASFIIQSIHRIRKTMQMQQYMGFLVDCSGLLKLGSLQSTVTKPLHIFKELDTGVCSVACCFVECGSTRVLPMLEPLFAVLLQRAPTNSDKMKLSVETLLLARAALSILAMFSLDLSKMSSSDNKSVFCHLSKPFKILVEEWIFKLLVQCSLAMDSVKSTTVENWIRPLIVLLASEPDILCNVFNLLPSMLEKLDASEQTKLLDLYMLRVIQNPRLGTMIRHHIQDLIAVAQTLTMKKEETGNENRAIRILVELEHISK